MIGTPDTGNLEMGGSVASQSDLLGDTQTSERPRLQNKNHNEIPSEHSRTNSLSSSHECDHCSHPGAQSSSGSGTRPAKTTQQDGPAFPQMAHWTGGRVYKTKSTTSRTKQANQNQTQKRSRERGMLGAPVGNRELGVPAESGS